MQYLLGEAAFEMNWPLPPLHAPIGQYESCLAARAEFPTQRAVQNRLWEEYLAITAALLAAGLHDVIRIVYSHEPDTAVLLTLGECGMRLLRLPPEYPDFYTRYPRDMGVQLPNCGLLAPEFRPGKEQDGIQAHPYGVGGRVLHRHTVGCIASRICDGANSQPARPEFLEAAGLQTAVLPVPAVAIEDPADEEKCGVTNNDHLDRVAALIERPNGSLFLIIDPGYYTLRSGVVYEPEDVIPHIRDRCRKVGVDLIVPRYPLRVPYALNLVQFPDGRVLMTGGDEQIADLISFQISRRQLIETEIPIQAYPACAYAGIRCLIGEIPDAAITVRP